MIINGKLEALEYLFGSYFYMDWETEYSGDLRKAIQDFSNEPDEALKQKAYDELTWLLSQNFDDAQLQQAFNEYIDSDHTFRKRNSFLKDIQIHLAKYIDSPLSSRLLTQ